MSDTPMTDDAEFTMYGSRLLVDADFARDLERQLNTANAENEKLKKLLKKRNRKNKQESQGMCTYEGMKGFVPI